MGKAELSLHPLEVTVLCLTWWPCQPCALSWWPCHSCAFLGGPASPVLSLVASPSRSSLVAPERSLGCHQKGDMGHPWEIIFALAILSFISVATFHLFPFWPSSLGCGGRLQADPSSRLILLQVDPSTCTLTPLPTENMALTHTELQTKQKN